MHAYFQSQAHLLSVFTVTIVESIMLPSIAGDSSVPRQVYWPPWEGITGSKVRVRVAVVSVSSSVPTVMPVPLTGMPFEESCHSRKGMFVRPIIVSVAEQVTVYNPPAEIL